MAKPYVQYGVAYWYLHYLPAAVGRNGKGCLQLWDAGHERVHQFFYIILMGYVSHIP